MPIRNRQAARASRPRIMLATCWLAAGIAVIASSERAYAAPHGGEYAAPRGGDIGAFAPPATTPDAEAIRLLVYRQDPLGTPRDLDIVRQRDSRGADIGNRGADADLIAARRDPDILAVSTGSHRMHPKRSRASHSSRMRHMN